MMEMPNLTELAQAYLHARDERLELERQANDIKTGKERELKDSIMQAMVAQGLKSAHIEGLCRVAARDMAHYEIVDMNVFLTTMFAGMLKCLQENRPLTDMLWLHNRPHTTNLDQYLEMLDPSDEDATLAAMGIRRVVKPDLSFSKVASHEA